jgi:hypothetical protein
MWKETINYFRLPKHQLESFSIPQNVTIWLERAFDLTVVLGIRTSSQIATT